MKGLFTLMLFVGLSSMLLAQQPGVELTSGPNFKWETMRIDVGDIPQGVPKTVEFKFKNTGMKPLVLSNVSSTCGCTIPEWPKEPLMPGQETVITATYNAKNLGVFKKPIYVESNVGEEKVTLYLEGNVLAPSN